MQNGNYPILTLDGTSPAGITALAPHSIFYKILYQKPKAKSTLELHLMRVSWNITKRGPSGFSVGFFID